MKRTSFLAKLKKEKKIRVVEPSEEIKTAYLQRSEESLRSAKVLFQINNLKDSVALTYYSMYYSLLALLFRTGIKCENHTGAIMRQRKPPTTHHRWVACSLPTVARGGFLTLLFPSRLTSFVHHRWTHRWKKQILKEIFEIDNEKIAAAKKERVDKQYYVDFEVTKEEVSEVIIVAEEFNSYLLNFMDNLNQNKIKEYREKTAKILD